MASQAPCLVWAIYGTASEHRLEVKKIAYEPWPSPFSVQPNSASSAARPLSGRIADIRLVRLVTRSRRVSNLLAIRNRQFREGSLDCRDLGAQLIECFERQFSPTPAGAPNSDHDRALAHKSPIHERTLDKGVGLYHQIVPPSVVLV